MKVVVDCRYVRTDYHDGISRFTVGIVSELARLHPITILVSDPRQRPMLPDVPYALVSGATSLREPLVAIQVNRLEPDVVFTPMQTMGSFGRRYRLVCTVHDLIYYRYRIPPPDLPALVRALWRLYHLMWWPQRLLLARTDAVVVVSETTKAELINHRLTRRPIMVVPNAAAMVREPDSPNRSREQSVVYMGSFMPYKNVETLVRAVAALPGYRLHLMSRISDRQRSRLTEVAPGADLVFHNGASNQCHAETLRTVLALVSASRDEGFGLPLVEAMAQGTPLVVSDIPVFREIAGDAALFASPDDPSSFTAAIRSLGDGEVWQRLSAAARTRSGYFSWSASGAQLLSVLRAVAAADGGGGRR